MSHDATETLVIAAIMLLLATFAPLYGAVLSLVVVWRADQNSQPARRNIAVICAAFAVFNLVFPSVFYIPHILLGLH